MTDIYKPRFTNGGDEPSGECAVALDMDNPSSPTYTAPLNGGTCSAGEPRLTSDNHDSTGVGEQNSCRRSMGDASKEELRNISADNVGAERTSPTIIQAAKAMAALHGDDAHYDDKSYLVWLDEAETAFKVFQEGQYTREELAAIIEPFAVQWCDIHAAEGAIDALIALGVVRVKD